VGLCLDYARDGRCTYVNRKTGGGCRFYHISHDWVPERPSDAALVARWERETGIALPEHRRQAGRVHLTPPEGLGDRYHERDADHASGGAGRGYGGGYAGGASPAPWHGASASAAGAAADEVAARAARASSSAAAAAAPGAPHIPRKRALDLDPHAKFAMELIYDPPPELAAAADARGFVPAAGVEAAFRANPGAPTGGGMHTGRRFRDWLGRLRRLETLWRGDALWVRPWPTGRRSRSRSPPPPPPPPPPRGRDRAARRSSRSRSRDRDRGRDSRGRRT
jgi:hypothetical protein